MERELWKVLYRLARLLNNPRGSWRFSTANVLAVYFRAVVHDRATRWATNPERWPDDLRPAWMPSLGTLSRRLRRATTVELMTSVEQHLMTLLAIGGRLVQRIDGKALATAAKQLAGYDPSSC